MSNTAISAFILGRRTPRSASFARDAASDVILRTHSSNVISFSSRTYFARTRVNVAYARGCAPASRHDGGTEPESEPKATHGWTSATFMSSSLSEKKIAIGDFGFASNKRSAASAGSTFISFAIASSLVDRGVDAARLVAQVRPVRARDARHRRQLVRRREAARRINERARESDRSFVARLLHDRVHPLLFVRGWRTIGVADHHLARIAR